MTCGKGDNPRTAGACDQRISGKSAGGVSSGKGTQARGRSTPPSALYDALPPSHNLGSLVPPPTSRAVLKGKREKGLRNAKQKRTWALSASRSWDLKVGGSRFGGGWRLMAVGGGWRRLAIGGDWRLAVDGGWRRLAAVGDWWRLAVGG